MKALETFAATAAAAVLILPGAASAAPAAAGLASPAPVASGAAQSAVQFRAQVTAKAQALLSAEMAGEVSEARFRDGEAFKKGDVLVQYECALPKARLARAEAALSAAEGRWRSARDLKRLNSISAADYEEARAGAGMARAEAEAERIQVSRCSIHAPFAGVVGESYVRPHEYVGEGQKLLSIYDVSAFEVEAILPAAALKVLRIGSALTITLEDTGDAYPVRIVRIAGSVDPVSQSVKVTGELIRSENEAKASKGSAGAKSAHPLLPGMSGTVAWSPE